MKLKLFFSMMAAAAMVFTGCNKQTELEINYGKTARLEGKVTIFEQEGGTCQPAADVKVYAEVPYSMLTTAANSNNNGGSGTSSTQSSNLQGDKIFETTTDENGVYSFEIPVTDNFTSSSSFNVYTERKELNEKYYYGEIEVDDFSTSVNSTTIENIAMYAAESNEATRVVKGKVFIQSNNQSSTGSTGSTTQANNTPAAGFKVVAEVDSREFTTTTNAQGEYEFSLPNVDNNNISISVPAQAVNGKDYNGSPVPSYPPYPYNPDEDGKVDDITISENSSSSNN